MPGSSVANPKSQSLADKRALLASVTERVSWLNVEIRAHGNAGRNDRRQALVNELRGLERKADNLRREIKRAESPAYASRFYSARADR